jgi:hypothetical protein
LSCLYHGCGDSTVQPIGANLAEEAYLALTIATSSSSPPPSGTRSAGTASRPPRPACPPKMPLS